MLGSPPPPHTTLSLSLSLSHSFSLSFSLSLCLSLCLSPSLPLFPPTLFWSVSASIFLSVSISVSLSISPPPPPLSLCLSSLPPLCLSFSLSVPQLNLTVLYSVFIQFCLLLLSFLLAPMCICSLFVGPFLLSNSYCPTSF